MLVVRERPNLLEEASSDSVVSYANYMVLKTLCNFPFSKFASAMLQKYTDIF